MLGEQNKVVGGTTEKSGCCNGAILFRCAQLCCLFVMIVRAVWYYGVVQLSSVRLIDVCHREEGNSVTRETKIELIVLQCGTQVVRRGWELVCESESALLSSSSRSVLMTISTSSTTRHGNRPFSSRRLPRNHQRPSWP